FGHKVMAKKVEKPIRDHIIGRERTTLLQQLRETNRCREELLFFLPPGDNQSAVISLEEEFLQQPSGTTIPSEILHNNRFYPYFK
ncbi:hypothetical protein S83_007618, partial [Arachis hypogaea]